MIEDGDLRQLLFIRLTKGLDPIQQRISIFSHIRDIPYAIVPEWRNADDIITLMIQKNKGWCGPKHHLLIWMFRKLGIKAEPLIIPFRWQDQNVKYPDSIRKILPSLPDTNHLCSRVFLHDQWQIIDATWDKSLKKAGFQVNESWDGLSGTLPAVTKINPEERRQVIFSSMYKKQKSEKFVDLLNSWMEELRV